MRWCKIADFRETRTWENPKARNLYLWLVVSAIYPEAKKIISLDKLGRQTGMSKAAARHCVKLMVDDGLITYKPGQIIINDPSRPIERPLDRPIERPPIERPIERPIDGQPITDPLPILRALSDEIERDLEVQHGSLHKFMEPFCQIQAAQGRSWPNETELKRHFVNWVMKNYGRQIVENKIKTAAAKQKAAEEAEYKRQQAAAQQDTPEQSMTKFIIYLKQQAAKGDKRAAAKLQDDDMIKWRQKLNI